MTHCNYCDNKITHKPFQCKQCKVLFCKNCQLPENHSCSYSIIQDKHHKDFATHINKPKSVFYAKPGSQAEENFNEILNQIAVFIFLSIVIIPVFNLWWLSKEISEVITLGVIVDIVSSLSTISLFILSGIFLWKKTPYAVKFTKVVLITTVIVNITILVLPILVSSAETDDAVGTVGIIMLIAWIWYFYKSERVKAVYGHLKEPTEGYQIWSIMALIYSFLSPFYSIVFTVIALINIHKNRNLKGLFLSIASIPIPIFFFILWVWGLYFMV